MCGMWAYYIAQIGLSAASAIVQYRAEKEQAEAEVAYQEALGAAQNKAMEQTAQNAVKEQTEATTAERQRQMQENEVAARALQQNQTDYLQKKGQAVASSPHGAGASFDALMADYGRAYALNNDIAREQLRMQGVSADANIRGYYDSAASRINAQQSFIPRTVYGPSPWVHALGFAKQGMSVAGSAMGGMGGGD